jgi:hypothetical protein
MSADLVPMRPISLIQPLGGTCPNCGRLNTLGIYRVPWYHANGRWLGWRNRKLCSQCEYDTPGGKTAS